MPLKLNPTLSNLTLAYPLIHIEQKIIICSTLRTRTCPLTPIWVWAPISMYEPIYDDDKILKTYELED